MKGKDTYSERVVTKIANAAATSVPGVEEIDSSWADLGNRSYPRSDVRIDNDSGIVQVDSFIAVSWPAPVTDIAAKVQQNIHSWLTSMTGLTPSLINVTVEQTFNRAGRITAGQVSGAAVKPLLTPVKVSGSGYVQTPVLKAGVVIRSPEVAKERALSEIRTASRPEPASPQIKAEVPLSKIHVAKEKPVREPVAPEPPTTWSPREPEPLKVYSPREPRPLRPWTPRLPYAPRLAPVHTAPEFEPFVPSLRDEQPLTPVVTRDFKSPATPQTPQELTLRKVEARPLTPRPVSLPRQQRLLRPVAPSPSPVLSVRLPPAPPLKPIQIQGLFTNVERGGRRVR